MTIRKEEIIKLQAIQTEKSPKVDPKLQQMMEK